LELLSRPCVRESSLYVKLRNERVQCILCERRCIIDTENVGVCRTRKNIGGKLYTLTYGDVSAIESRPIEIKPFFHYWPGSTALTFSTWSCNFDCSWCQNYNLSRVEPVPERSESVPPATIVGVAKDSGDEGLCGSFQEPTLLTDWAADVFAFAKTRGLYCCYVSNGYMTTEALELLRRSGLDGLKIDVKGDDETYRRYCGSVCANVPWRNAEAAKKMGIHIEIVNLIIPGVNDSDSTIAAVVEQHVKRLGPDTPLHFTRYVPAYKFRAPTTSIQRLEYAREIARKAGVKYAYIGNVRGHDYENTYCPECNERVIARDGHVIVSYRLTEGNRCPMCRTEIPITGRYVKNDRPLDGH
jgi:pyruvate formate lyase activating enzyme